ncbi:hypothetical protein RF11_11050 [Thelohanellus kitauei]|uniref:Winged helix-turn helix domain-containing protein n=1 Tax=Thelohanellus kitauei TaxID=669202 RepID=A0A0C2MQ64_THEKT|nr:hypothetical protein RF11_11050 [Thelohanellus kitauei]
MFPKRNLSDSHIPGTTARSFLKKYETSDRIEADQGGGRKFAKITLEIENQIRQLVADNCTTTIQWIIDTLELDVCHTTVWRWLKKNSYSWKITRPIPEKRNDPEIKAYSHIVYIDESPFNLHIFKSHGWSYVGTTPNPIVPNSVDKIILMAVLGEGDFIIVLDNIRLNRPAVNYMDHFPCDVKFLLRYSQFLNPIEEAFSMLKNRVRMDGVPQGTNDLVRRMTDSCEESP